MFLAFFGTLLVNPVETLKIAALSAPFRTLNGLVF